MANYFLDASALVKYYVTEPGSTWVRRLIDGEDPVTGRPLHFMLVAEITRVEVAAGIAVIERIGGSIHLAMAADADQDDVLLPQFQLEGDAIV